MKESRDKNNIIAKQPSEEWRITADQEDFETSCQAKLEEDGHFKENSMKQIIQEAIEYCNTIKDTSLTSIQIKNLQDGLRNEEKNMTIVDLVGFVNITSSKGIFKNSKKEFKPFYSVSITNTYSDVECLPVFGSKLKALIDRTREISRKWVARGFFIPLPKKGNSYARYFYIIGIQEYVGTYKSYDFTKSEILYAKKLIQENQEHLKSFILKNIKRHLRIKKLNDNMELKKSIEFVILQALSSNEIDSKNGRLHSIVWGPPSSGKNFLIKAIELLNLEFREGQSGKMTVAGLLGACSTKNGKYISEAGLLPQALYGVFAIQDFHSLESNQKNNFHGVASKAMQDGKAIDSTASKVTYLAQTAIHLDANKTSDITHKKDDEFDFDKEFGVPHHILTRFDFLMSMPANPKLQFETSREMLRESKVQCELENPEKTLKLMIAMLREEFPIITISEEVRSRAQEKLNELYEDNKQSFNTNAEVAIFQNRLSSSIIKLLHSIARLNRRGHSRLEDVDYVIYFLEPKISFLKHFDSSIQVASLLSKNEKARKCQEFIIKKFNEESFTIKEVIGKMSSSPDLVISVNVSERTVRRYVEAVAYSNKKDEWKIKKDFRHN